MTHADATETPLVAILRNIEPMKEQSFTPPGDADRIQQTADLVGETIRVAVKATSKSIRDLLAEARAQLDAIEHDAETFIESMEEIGHAHAARIEGALIGLKNVSSAIAEQKSAVVKLALVKPNGKADA